MRTWERLEKHLEENLPRSLNTEGKAQEKKTIIISRIPDRKQNKERVEETLVVEEFSIGILISSKERRQACIFMLK